MATTRHITSEMQRERSIRILNTFIKHMKEASRRSNEPVDKKKLGELKYAKRLYRKKKI
jgi:hypothetical protein